MSLLRSDSRETIELELRPLDARQQPGFGLVPSNNLSRAFDYFKARAVFFFAVVVPVAICSVYYLFIAADLYVSEARFIVRGASASARLGGAQGATQVSSLVRTNDDTQSVNEYLASRDAVDRLIKEEGYLEVLNRPEADFFSRFPRLASEGSREALFQRLDSFIHADYDSTSGISTLYVKAFRAEDARQIARALLMQAEQLVNRLNERARKDAIVFAQDVVARSEAKVREAQQNVANFRNMEMVFDPVRQAVAIIDLIGKLAADSAQLKASLGELTANAPDSPKMAGVRARIRALEQQIDEQRGLIAGNNNSLAPKLAEYEKLTLVRELATKTFVSALLSLENARQDAQRQQLYLERIVEPNLADLPLYPRRWLEIGKTLLFALCLYWILKVLGGVVLEHDP